MCDVSFHVDDSFLEKYSRSAFTLGSYFQGALMEILADDMARKLHENDSGVNPYSQSVYMCRTPYGDDQLDIYSKDGSRIPSGKDGIIPGKGSRLVWTIAIIGEDLQYQLIDKLERHERIFIKKIDTTFEVSSVQVRRMLSLDDFKKELVDVFNGAGADDTKDNSRHKIQFWTPTSFKSAGDYQIMPSAKLILQNLAMKHSALLDTADELPEDMINAFEKFTRISSFSLRSQYMPIEQTKIPAFMGTVTLSVSGAKSMRNYIAMLLKFGEVFGCGIKTSMGMGAMRVVPEKTRLRADVREYHES